MAKFNYTNLHFFDKYGIELPISYQTNFAIEIQNEYNDNAVFYGLLDSSTNEFEYIRKSSGNRFSNKEKDPCVVSINGTYYKTEAVTVKEQNTASSSDEPEYYIKDISTLYTNDAIENEINSISFPSITLSSALGLSRVSVDLVETQAIYVLAEENNVFMKLNESEDAKEWISRYKLLFFIDNRNQTDFRFFNADSNEIVWSDRTFLNFENGDFKANIGFCAKEEGVYEQTLYICLLENFDENDPTSGNLYSIGSIQLQAEAVGEDERYRTLFQNFGIPDPIKYQEVFFNTSLEEEKMDYIKLNENSKKMFLSYSEIFSYIGTYKALINAVKVLGYTDIFFKEWYKELGRTISGQGYVTYDMTYMSDANANTINNVPIEERISLKKLNWLSMIYRINKELIDSAEDQWGFPQVVEVYDNHNEEILAKLYSLKKWLEKYIIGLNCKIVDVSGEGIYFERYKLDSYGSFQQIYDWDNSKNLIPKIVTSEDDEPIDYRLIDTSAFIKVDVGLDNAGVIEDYKHYTLEDFTEGFIDADGIYHQRLPEENEDASVYVGQTFACLNDFERYELRASSSGESFLFNEDYLTEDSAKLRVQDNRIFFNPYDLLTKEKQSVFTLLPFIQLENANIRKFESNWNNSIVYKIFPDAAEDTLESYIVKNIASGEVYKSTDYVMLIPPTYSEEDGSINITSFSGKEISKDAYYIPDFTSDSSTGIPETLYTKTIRTYGLKYSANNLLNIPLFTILGYEVNGNSDFIDINNEYFLEILDGKMLFNDEKNNRKIFLNFNYDYENNEQTVEINIIYTSDEFGIVTYVDENNNKFPAFIPGNEYSSFVNHYYTSPDESIIYENIHEIEVKNTGKFLVDVYAKDIHNNIFAKNCENYAYVNLPEFSMTTYTNTETSGNEITVEGTKLEEDILTQLCKTYHTFCIYNNSYLITDISKSIDDNNESISVKYPNYSYSFYNAKAGDYLHFMNIADKYLVNGIDYSYSSTLNTQYKGYGIVLEKNSTKYKMKVIDEYNENALQSIVNGSFPADSTTTWEYMQKLHDDGNDIEYTDVNLILYNELGNYPVLQTYGTMVCENAMPLIEDNEGKYKKKKYRLFIGDYSEKAYVWASLREHAEQDIPAIVLNRINAARIQTLDPSSSDLDGMTIEDGIVYDPTLIFVIEDDKITVEDIVNSEIDKNAQEEDKENPREKYIPLESSDLTFKDIADDFTTDLENSSLQISSGEITEDELISIFDTYKTSIENIIHRYDISEQITDSSLDSLVSYIQGIESELKYSLTAGEENERQLYYDTRSKICLNNQEILDTYINDYLANEFKDGTNINMHNLLSTNDLYQNIPAYTGENVNSQLTEMLNSAEIDDDMLSVIIDAVVKGLKTYGNNISAIYNEFINNFYNNYNKITSLTAPIDSDNVYKSLLIEENENICSEVRDAARGIIISSCDQFRNIDIDNITDFLMVYTKILFASCAYLGVCACNYMLTAYEVKDTAHSKYNNVYAEFLETARKDVVVESFVYTIKAAYGLRQSIFEKESSFANIHDSLVSKFSDDGGNKPLYEKLKYNLANLIADCIIDKWVLKYGVKENDEHKLVETGDIWYAVAGKVEKEKEPEISEEDPVISDSLFYVKCPEFVDEGFTYTDPVDLNIHTIPVTPQNAIPDLAEMFASPYISVYVQPTWKAQVNISLITREAAERLGLDIPEDETARLDYLCIQYVDSAFGWHFRKGEMIKLVFESLTNNEYIGQSSYEVVGYDVEEQVVIVRGLINNAYVRGEKHEIWAKIDESIPDFKKLIDSDAEFKETIAQFENQSDVSERDCKPIKRIYDRDNIRMQYNLPIRKVDGIWYYKVLYLDEKTNTFRAIETQKIDPQEKVNMYISYSHNAFVDYIVKAKNSVEDKNGTTTLDINYNLLNCRKMQFVDDTFVMYAKEFDVNEGLGAWMNVATNSNDTQVPAIALNDVYSYTKELGFVPVEVSAENSNIVFKINFEDLVGKVEEDENQDTISDDTSEDSSINFDASAGYDSSTDYNDEEEDETPVNDYYNDFFVQWKVYRMIPLNNERELMFESYNKVLYLDYAEPGIYDIEANVYDKYGNTLKKLFKGAYKVK